MTRKEAAIDFLEHAASGDVHYAYDHHVAVGFLHHNAFFKGDADSLKAGMIEAHAQSPIRMFEVRHAIEEGDLVAVHSRVVKEDEQEIAVVHLLRFDDTDRIIEFWDVAQEAPKEFPNQHGMF